MISCLYDYCPDSKVDLGISGCLRLRSLLACLLAVSFGPDFFVFIGATVSTDYFNRKQSH